MGHSTTTRALAGAVRDALRAPADRGRRLAVRRVFQALRIEVNDEFGALGGAPSPVARLPAPRRTRRAGDLSFRRGSPREESVRGRRARRRLRTRLARSDPRVAGRTAGQPSCEGRQTAFGTTNPIMVITLDDLRRFAVARSLFPPTTLHARIETLGLRAGRSDPRAGARAGPDAAPPRQGLPRRRPGAPLRDARCRGGLLHQLRLRARAGAGVDASARGHRRAGRGARRKQAEALLEFVRERGAVHPRDVDRAFLARHGDELLGRLVERHDPSAGRHALPRPAARRAARRRHPHLRGARARAAAPADDGRTPAQTRADRCARRRRSCASTRRCPGASLSRACEPAALRRAAMARRADRAPCSGPSSVCRRRRVDGVDWYWPADERLQRSAPQETRPPAGAFRSGRLGPPPLRAVMGLGLSVRGLHAGAQTQAAATTRCRCSGATA